MPDVTLSHTTTEKLLNLIDKLGEESFAKMLTISQEEAKEFEALSTAIEVAQQYLGGTPNNETELTLLLKGTPR